MRNYIDTEGRFEFEISPDWVQQNEILDAPSGAPITFSLADNAVGSFQVSCRTISSPVVKQLIQQHSVIIQEDITKEFKFTEDLVKSDRWDVFNWFGAAGEFFFMITFVHDANTSGRPKVKKEIEKCRKCIRSVRIIPENKRVSAIQNRRFSKFMTSLAASIDLSNRALTKGSGIEFIVLIANQIDALLRLAIILNGQIVNKTRNIELGLIYQSEEDRPVMEKQIYKRALKEALVNQDTHDQLFELYNERNKVIHRYIITDITTKQVMNIGFKFGEINAKISKLVSNLEKRQFEEKVGMYGDRNPEKDMDKDTIKLLLGKLKEKHASSIISNDITIIREEE